MGVMLSIHLFGKPAWEIDNFEGCELDAEFSNVLRALGDNLRSRLYEIARVHELLVRNGWTAYGTLYDIDYYKDVSIEEAEKELRSMGLDNLVDLLEEEFEEEEVIE